jgi:arylsulfatase A-like enzyme
MAALRPPSFNIVGSKQPPWLKAEPVQDPSELDEVRREQLRATLPLDDMVVGILSTLGTAGQLNDTLFVFTTDQSVATGEHRLRGKHHPYASTTDVPLAIRWPGGTGGTSFQLVTHIDITATICAMAGLTPGHSLDGVDIRANVRADALLHWSGGDNGGNNWTTDFVPAFSAVRTNSFKYVRIKASGFEELYALPGPEIDNVASDPAYAPVKFALAERLNQLVA